MRRSLASWVIATAGICLVANIASAQFPPITDPNKDEVKCETGTGNALTKFIGAKAKCTQKCITTARKTMGPYTGCFASGPYDTATDACIHDALKGALPKAQAAVGKACAVDCPECYSGAPNNDPTICTNGGSLLTNADNQTNLFGILITCEENGGTTPSKTDAKCEDGTGKALVKFLGSKGKCYQKCDQNMIKGKIANGSCTPPASDPATQTCISTVETKTAASIDKACTPPAGSVPSCFTLYSTGAQWTAAVENAVDTSVPNIACGG